MEKEKRFFVFQSAVYRFKTGNFMFFSKNPIVYMTKLRLFAIIFVKNWQKGCIFVFSVL